MCGLGSSAAPPVAMNGPEKSAPRPKHHAAWDLLVARIEANLSCVLAHGFVVEVVEGQLRRPG